VGLTETLRLLIDADTRGAVSGVEKVGATTQKELGKSQQSIDKWASGLTNAGAAMIGVGGAALFGLGKMAQASEEANLAQVQLQNALGNMPKLAGENSKQFTDLADKLQSVTAADGDAIVSGEAMLATFNLTAGQIKEMTPLIVDYARRFGVDIPTAAATVGKALDGNIGALKRNGISIDEAAFAADHYTAVQAALSKQVGGFAQQEGATFAGSLQRMKNELGDLAEGVGGGAVDAFTTLFGVVEGVTNKLNDISPRAQNAAGEIATFASVGLVAAGSLSFLIGQAIQARLRFAAMGDAAVAMGEKVGLSELAITRLGGALRTLGTVGAVVTALALVREAIGTINDEVDRTDLSQLQKELLDLAQSGEASGETLKRVFDGIDVSDPEKWAQAAADLDQLDKALAELAGRDPAAAAASFHLISDALKEGGASADQVKGIFDEYRAALADADVANRTSKEGIDGTAGSLGEQADAFDDAKSAAEQYADTLKAQFDPLFAAIDAGNQLRDAQIAVAQATEDLATAQREHGVDSDEAAEAQRNLTDAELAGVEAAANQEDALAGLRDAVEKGTVSVDSAKGRLALWVAQGKITQEQANTTAAAFDAYTYAANQIPIGKNTVLSITGAEDSRLAIVRVQDALGNVTDKTVTLRVNAAIGQQAVNIINSKLLGFDVGGVVPGPKGSPQLVLAHGGETIVPTHDQAAMAAFTPTPSAMASGGGMGRTMVVHIGQVVANDPVTLVEQLKRYERVNGTGWRN